jgi:hypothetical protein
MPHITFIHGIANKPACEPLHEAWRRTLRDGDGLDLGAEGVTSSMVYWADVMYEAPLSEEGYESIEDFESAGAMPISPAQAESEAAWEAELSPEERQLVEGLARKVGLPQLEAEKPAPTAAVSGKEYERVLLPWFVKREIMKAFLRDVHHYLFNETHSPRPGASFPVQTEIRRRFLAALAEGEGQHPHVVVSHSMGTVIAYDCLKRAPGCPAVDGLMTVGSPLAIDEVQDKLRPEWTRDHGFPEKLHGPWINVYDSLDPVTGFDWNMANDFRKSGQEAIEVINEQNWGKWRHSISKYLKGPKLRNALKRLLGLSERV